MLKGSKVKIEFKIDEILLISKIVQNIQWKNAIKANKGSLSSIKC